MPEKETQLKSYQVDYICDQCGEGEMHGTGEMLDGAKKTFRGKVYPAYITKPEN